MKVSFCEFLHHAFSPRTESYAQIFQNDVLIVKMFVFCLTFSARKSLSLKIALALQWTGDFAHHPPPRLPKWGVAHALHEGLGSPWTLPFACFENFQLSHRVLSRITKLFKFQCRLFHSEPFGFSLFFLLSLFFYPIMILQSIDQFSSKRFQKNHIKH